MKHSIEIPHWRKEREVLRLWSAGLSVFECVHMGERREKMSDRALFPQHLSLTFSLLLTLSLSLPQAPLLSAAASPKSLGKATAQVWKSWICGLWKGKHLSRLNSPTAKAHLTRTSAAFEGINTSRKQKGRRKTNTNRQHWSGWTCFSRLHPIMNVWNLQHDSYGKCLLCHASPTSVSFKTFITAIY